MTTLAELFEALALRVVVDEYGTRKYFNAAGQLHRDAGPAVEYANGTGLWFHNGVLHRADGPAIVYADGTCEWWIKGLPQSKQSYLAYLAEGGKE
jgi:hypothetical protein